MRSIDEIYNEMVRDYEEKGSLVLTEGGDMSLRLRAVAAQIFSLENQLDFSRRQAYPQTAEGEYLDRHAAVRGLSRGGAGTARGSIRFFVEEAGGADLAVSAGVVCTDAAGTEFITTEGGTIKAGGLYCDVPAMAVLPGESGNVPANAVCLMPLAPIGVAGCKNTEPFVGGSEGESDEQLRSRVLASYSSLPNGANAAYYEQQALATEGVYAAQVLPRKRGAGTVDIVVASRDGAPEGDVVAAVQEKLDAQREICVDLAVYGPQILAVNVAVEIAADDFTVAKKAVQKAVEEYFTGALLGKSLLLAHLANAVYTAQGVKNYRILSPAADVAAAEGVLPVLGDLTITEMEA